MGCVDSRLSSDSCIITDIAFGPVTTLCCNCSTLETCYQRNTAYPNRLFHNATDSCGINGMYCDIDGGKVLGYIIIPVIVFIALTIVGACICRSRWKRHQWIKQQQQRDTTQPYIGVTYGVSATHPGVYIGMIDFNSPAQHAGLLVGDHVIAIDTFPIQQLLDIERYKQMHPWVVGNTVTVTIIRHGHVNPMTIPVIIGTKLPLIQPISNHIQEHQPIMVIRTSNPQSYTMMN